MQVIFLGDPWPSNAGGQRSNNGLLRRTKFKHFHWAVRNFYASWRRNSLFPHDQIILENEN